MTNQTAMQYFEWYLPSDGQHWNNLAEDAQHLADLGISHVWMPPAFKATNKDDVGYGVYDLFDLGEFDQKGTVRTKYGLKEEYLNAINQLKEVGIVPMADVVLNHKAAADKLETFEVVEVDPEDRTQEISEPFEIEGWTHFTFDGRNKAYNDFEWHWYHFNGTDFDAKRNKSGIYLIQGDNKGWADNDLVDNENGNFDYLMYANLDYNTLKLLKTFTNGQIGSLKQQAFKDSAWMQSSTLIHSSCVTLFVMSKKNKVRISMSLVNFGMVTKRKIISILKRLKNVLTSSMFPSTTIYTRLA